ncbi:hemicentin-2-like isoform X2 [Cyprinus carpio]|uniref:Hemicentin-2-like isoform X2 n=1 Tax=Cyprinus carpio TaxID=7962 RepID=A0A9R0AXS5_CYPCA|nr:hemicentin-2-like isoform X2 [Cyprinus carpio]
MLSIIIVLLTLLIETSVSLTVKVPPDPVVAHVGSTVTLPCWISPPESAEALEIRWYRHDQFNNPVLLFNYGKIQDVQEKQYRNQSSLTLRSDQSGGLKDGDVSLQLEKLRVQDDGSFRCYVSGENSYSSEEVFLKITALGSAPVLSPRPLDDGRVNISCRSSGWYPKPSITWTSDEGRALGPGGTSHSRGADEMFSVHSWTAVSLSDAQQVSCSFSLRSGELKEGRLNIQGIVSSVSLTVKVPPDPIVSHVGSTVILPCWISPPENAEALEIRWYRNNQFNNPVLLYNHGKIQDIQECFRKRSSLTPRSDQSGGLKDGDVSLRLEKLSYQDEDSFHCYVSGESSYDCKIVDLKITALGSSPVLSPKPLDDGRVNISCGSSGWYPEPSITWTSDEGRTLHPGGTSHSRGADKMFSVHSWTAVSLSDAQLVSCSVSLRSGELKEGRLNIQGIVSSVSLTVKVPPDPIVSHVGSTVTLPCWISPPENAEALEIRWYRNDQFSNPVLLFNYGKIQDVQEESYRNRSSLTLRSDQSGGLKDGDVSLQLEKLRVQDDGSFRCYVSGEHSYGSEEVVLKITALGSAPVLSPKPLDDGRVNISCRSSGWYPKPSITWTSDEGRALRPGGTSHSRGADEMFSVHSWTAVSLSDAQLVSCSVSLRSGELKEGRLNIQGIVSSDSSGPWKALFFSVLICALLGSVGFILYKYREKRTGKKPATEIVVDITIEELRKHAVEITIDRESLHPDLTVSKDCKILRDSEGYNHTGEEFPFQLCAFGAQRFSSGRHYWEVDLVRSPNPPKNFWIIGVVKHGNLITKDRSALTPSAGFWFLCSDGPRGFYTNTDPPVKLSLTLRPERLGVLLDYDDGQLSFYNVTENKHLLTISSRFSGSVVPLFNPGAGDKSPLIILDCPKPEEPAESSQPLLSNNSSDA